MLSIRSSADLARAFDGLLDPAFRRFLTLRRNQLVEEKGDLAGLVHFIIANLPSDSLAAVQAEAGFPLTGDAAPIEWVERHPGGLLEAAIITDDDGFAVVVVVRNCITTDPGLLAALLAHA